MGKIIGYHFLKHLPDIYGKECFAIIDKKKQQIDIYFANKWVAWMPLKEFVEIAKEIEQLNGKWINWSRL